MAKTSWNDYSASAASNTDIDSIDISEGCAPSGINNAIREIMAHTADVVAGTTAVTSFKVAGDLTVDTNTLYVDSSNNRVGIGTASPTTGMQLHIDNSSGNAQELIKAGTNFNSTIDFGDQDANDTGEIKYAHNGDFMAFKTNGAEAVKIDSSKRVQIGNVDASTTTSAKNDALLTLIDTGTANPMARIAFDSGDSGVSNGVKIGYTAATFAPDFEIANGDAGIIRLSTNNTERLRIQSDGDVLIGATGGVYGERLFVDQGSSENQLGIFVRAQNTSYTGTLVRAQSNTTSIGGNYKYFEGLSTGGALNFHVKSDGSGYFAGKVGINTTTDTRAVLNIDTDGTNNATGYGLALTNTAGGGGTWTLQCGDQAVDNGAFTIRTTGISGTTRLKITSAGIFVVPGVYAQTISSAANVFVGSSGILYRSTSSRRYKNSIEDATHGLTELLALRPVTYKGNNDDDGDTVFGGLIAEEVHDAGLTEFVQYNDNDEPDALAYGNMVSLCIKAIQEQQETIKKLEARIAALEA